MTRLVLALALGLIATSSAAAPQAGQKPLESLQMLIEDKTRPGCVRAADGTPKPRRVSPALYLAPK